MGIRSSAVLSSGLLLGLGLLIGSAPPAQAAPGQAATGQAQPSAASPPAAALESEAWSLFVQGTAASRGQALERLAAARQLLQASGDDAKLAQLWQMEGLVLFALARYRESNDAYGRSLQLYGRLNRPGDQASLRLSLAMGHLNLGEYAKARQELAQVAAEARRSGETRLLVTALDLEAQVDAKSGQPQAAIRKLEQALALARARQDKREQLRILDSLAMVQLPLGRLAEVRRIVEQRKALAPEETSLAEMVLKTVETRSRPEELSSIPQLEEQIRRFRQAGDLTNTATSLESLATVVLNRGQLRRGLALYQEALGLFEQQGMRGRAASALRNVGQTLAALGDYGRSLEATGRALELARAVGEAGVQTQALLDLADLQVSLGSLDLAASSFEAGLTLAAAQRDQFRQAQALNGLADLRRRQQKPAEAAQLADRALTIGAASRVPLLQVSALSTLARARESLGELDAAMEAAQRIAAISRSTGDRWMGATGDALQGRVLLARQRPDQALEALNRGIAVFREQNQLQALIANLELRALALVALERLGPALETYREVERLCSEMGDPRCQAAVLYQQSRLSARQGRLEEALEAIGRSLSITEGLRTTLPSADLRQSYFAQVQDHYDWSVELLLQLHQRQPGRRFDLQALEVSERARARGLVELLSSAQAEAASGVDPQLLDRRRQLDGRIRERMAGRLRLRQSGSAGAEQAAALAALEVELADLQRRQQQLEQELRRASPRYADLLLPRPLKAETIRSLLDRDTLLLEIHLGETRGVLWLISDQGVSSHPLPPRAEVETLVRSFHADLHSGRPGESAAARALSQALLQPVADRLTGKRLVVVPHGGLFYLPFAALPAPGSDRPLVEAHELLSLPSASTLAVLRSSTPAVTGGAPSLLLLADPVFGRDDPRLSGSGRAAPTATATGSSATPPTAGIEQRAAGEDTTWQRLPGTAREAEAILALLPPGSAQRRDIGFQASRQALLSDDLTSYRLVHIATHGKADGLQPERSRLVLSLFGADGRPVAGTLRLQDLYNLRLNADLVVLSACQSGLGPLVRGEGLVGLTRGFHYAGARRVVASLWNVDDGSTATLMSSFYRGLLIDRLTPAAALRQAQLQLLGDSATRSPYHWAAFVVHGDWR